MQKKPNITLLGLAWSGYWRMMILVLAIELIIVVIVLVIMFGFGLLLR